MRYLALAFIMFISAFTRAQVVTNVYRTVQSEQDRNNIVYYDFLKPLSWKEFRGEPGPKGPIAAMTTSGFGYKANMTSSEGKGEINVGVYCFFNRDKSWVKPGRNTPYILNHEQHHFDVSYLASALFVEKIKSANLTPANCNTLLPKIYRECCEVMNKMQDDYDGQTANGQIEEAQQRWNNFFSERLSYLASTN